MDMHQLNKERGQCGRTWRKRKRRGISSMPNLAKLNQWLSLKGCRSSSKLKPAYFPSTGRGMMATQRICPGDVLVSIPRELLVTCDDVLLDPKLQGHFHNSPVKLKAVEVLAFFLMYHRHLGDDSDWRPYLDSLPEAYTVPLYCSDDEISMFPEFMATRIAKQREDVNQCYDTIWKMVKNSFPSLAMDDVKWAWSTVNTRAVYLKNASPSSLVSDEDVSALAPYLDLLNHSFKAQVTAGVDPASGSYEVVTRDAYSPSEQVFISYGPHDNLVLYVEYGFVLRDNPHDFVPLSLDEVEAAAVNLTDGSRGALMDKKRILVQSRLDENIGVTPEGPSWTLEAASTIYLMTPAEMAGWQVVYEDLHRVPHRSLVVKCVALAIQWKIDLLRKSLVRATGLQGCSEAFATGKNLMEECCAILEKAKVLLD